MDDQNTFGPILKAVRSARRWSQSDLASATELSVDAISNLERGINQPSYSSLLTISAALEVPVADFFEADGQSRERSSAMAELIAKARQLDDRSLRTLVELADVLKRRYSDPSNEK